ncbi:hypothetical protein ACP4OV_007284 [Aristida adscensionis]
MAVAGEDDFPEVVGGISGVEEGAGNDDFPGGAPAAPAAFIPDVGDGAAENDFPVVSMPAVGEGAWGNGFPEEDPVAPAAAILAIIGDGAMDDNFREEDAVASTAAVEGDAGGDDFPEHALVAPAASIPGIADEVLKVEDDFPLPDETPVASMAAIEEGARGDDFPVISMPAVGEGGGGDGFPEEDPVAPAAAILAIGDRAVDDNFREDDAVASIAAVEGEAGDDDFPEDALVALAASIPAVVDRAMEVEPVEDGFPDEAPVASMAAVLEGAGADDFPEDAAVAPAATILSVADRAVKVEDDFPDEIPVTAVGEGAGGDDFSQVALVAPAVDRLSNLGDDLLIHVLEFLSLKDCATAFKTTILCRRWRGIWSKLRKLHLICPDSDCINAREALIARSLLQDCPDLLQLEISCSKDAEPDAVEDLLHLAASQLSGELRLRKPYDPGSGQVNRSTIDFPSFCKARRISLTLGRLTLSLPVPVVYDALKFLALYLVQFQEGLSITRAMFPHMIDLRIRRAHGLVDLYVQSNSLVRLSLSNILGLQHLNVEAASLRGLDVLLCLDWNARLSIINAPKLERLRWRNHYSEDQNFRFYKMPLLQMLALGFIPAYGTDANLTRDATRVLSVFAGFQCVPQISLTVVIDHDLRNLLYVLPTVHNFPHARNLHLVIETHGHEFGPSVSIILSRIPGVKMLKLGLSKNSKMEDGCQPNCICDQTFQWQNKQCQLRNLSEVEIYNFTGVKRESQIVELILSAAPRLRKIKIRCAQGFSVEEDCVMSSGRKNDVSLEVISRQ